MNKFKKFIKGELSHLQRQVVIELKPTSLSYCQLKNFSPKVVAKLPMQKEEISVKVENYFQTHYK